MRTLPGYSAEFLSATDLVAMPSAAYLFAVCGCRTSHGDRQRLQSSLRCDRTNLCDGDLLQ